MAAGAPRADRAGCVTMSDMHRLDGKVCLITGAGSGIGRATALLFAAEGASVAVADIDPAAAAETVRQIQEAEAAAAAADGPSGSSRGFTVDVTDPADCEALASDVIAAFGRIDVLFNNAGIAGVGVLHETSVELWDRVMAVNVRGVFLVARAVLPHMIAAGRGSIINMSSTIAEIGLANRASYAASKGAVLSLTRQMQADYAVNGIRVNALLPGTIHTPFVDRFLAESYDDPVAGLETLKKRQLTGDLGKPEQVASAALFLASDESSFVLGSACSWTAASGARSDRGNPMRLLSRRADDGERLAVVGRDDRVLDVQDLLGDGPWTMARLFDGDPAAVDRVRDAVGLAADHTHQGRSIADIELLPPIARPGKIVAVGRNYADHAAEQGVATADDPILFTKYSSSVIGRRRRHRVACGGHGPGGLRGGARRRHRHDARDVPLERALDHVLGYTLPERRLGARPPVRRRPMDPRQEPRHVLPDGPVARDRRRDPGPAGAAHPLPRQRRGPSRTRAPRRCSTAWRTSSRSARASSRSIRATSSRPGHRPGSASSASRHGSSRTAMRSSSTSRRRPAAQPLSDHPEVLTALPSAPCPTSSSSWSSS